MNMDYCKFHNTLSDLKQCADDWNSDNSESEKKAKQKLIELMIDILMNDENYEVISEDEQDDSNDDFPMSLEYSDEEDY
jgi:hypothetical protein